MILVVLNLPQSFSINMILSLKMVSLDIDARAPTSMPIEYKPYYKSVGSLVGFVVVLQPTAVLLEYDHFTECAWWRH